VPARLTGCEGCEGRGCRAVRGAGARRVVFSFAGWPGGVAAGGCAAGVADGSAVRAGHGDADGALPVLGYFVGEGAGEAGVDGPQFVQLSGPVGVVQEGGGGDGQVHPPGHRFIVPAGPGGRGAAAGAPSAAPARPAGPVPAGPVPAVVLPVVSAG